MFPAPLEVDRYLYWEEEGNVGVKLYVSGPSRGR